MEVWALVVAGGAGARFGRAKQYEVLAGRRVLDWSLAAARVAADGVVLAVPARRAADPEPGADLVVAGGETRSASVRAALAAVPKRVSLVIVHDAARPLAAPTLFHAVVAAVRAGADGAVCATPVTDTIKQVEAGVVVRTVDRTGLWAVQTPQCFTATALRAAHARGGDASDDAALVEAAGGTVAVVAGDSRNLKLTSPLDLAVAEAFAADLAVRPGSARSAAAAGDCDPAGDDADGDRR